MIKMDNAENDVSGIISSKTNCFYKMKFWKEKLVIKKGVSIIKIEKKRILPLRTNVINMVINFQFMKP